MTKNYLKAILENELNRVTKENKNKTGYSEMTKIKGDFYYFFIKKCIDQETEYLADLLKINENLDANEKIG